jgi:diguanylate cyclase (GGDEF)-like protein
MSWSVGAIPGRRHADRLLDCFHPCQDDRPTTSFVPSPEAIQASAAAPLQLEQALQLLAQSGRPVPAGEPGSPGWLQELIDALVDLSSRDALTGLANRRSFELALAREVDRVARSGEPALLLVLDVDHFKRVNDTFGHAAGDQVLRAVATALLDSVRPMDLVARIGGEEFAIILPNCPEPFGATVAERVRRRVERAPVVAGPGGQPIEVTISIGGAFAPQWVRSTPALWVERADQQLYRAKAQGRNLVQLEAGAVCFVSSEERQALFDTTFGFEDLE